MRIATWNVNSLGARLTKVTWWLERAQPDVLLMQETKLNDADVPRDELKRLGYELAITGRAAGTASRSPAGHAIADVITNFGLPLGAPATSGGARRRAAARAAHDRGRLRRHPRREPLRAQRPHRRLRLLPGEAGVVPAAAAWLVETRQPGEPLVLGGDFNVAPTDADVWDPARCHGGTHVSPPERQAFARSVRVGPRRRLPALHTEPERLQLVGLPRRHVPQELRHAHRSPAGDRADRRRVRVGGDRSRGAQGKADPVGSRPGDHRSRTRPAARIDAGWEGADARIAARRK
jgi:exodeoxyribonuclease-3